MKIVSLLPSATEIAFALGLGDAVEAVTDACDHPVAARAKPVVSRTTVPTEPARSAAEVDGAVRARSERGESIYELDAERISQIDPDLILTQDLCRVCAVPSGDVSAALDVLGCRAEVLSIDPSTLDEVIDSVERVGEATGTAALGRRIAGELRERVAAVREAVADGERPRTLALEWSDPPFSGGHWVPDMVEAAGGEVVLSASGTPSRTVTWDEVAEVSPDVVAFMPCGYGLDEAVSEGRRLLDVPALAGAGAVHATNANACFSRPGPRLVDGVEALASALHPGSMPPRPEVIVPLRP